MNEHYEDIKVIYTPMPAVDSPKCKYEGFKQESVVLPKGYIKEEGCLPLPCDIRLDRDVEVVMRDGTKIYCDIFRREGSNNIPAIVAWGPAGKRGAGDQLDMFSGTLGIPRLGIPKNALSGLQGWESADPAHWCQYDYAVVEVDPRGAYMSEGNVQIFGPQDAQDAYDFIEWLAVQPWCNGKVGMSGNSWYATSQWFTAAGRPPHLACIAPWEGHADMFREEYVRNGVPCPFVYGEDGSRSFGDGLCENIDQMILNYPVMNAYWESKVPAIENIEIPAYVVASYTNGNHTHGIFVAWNRLSSKEKWLRIHNTQEWPDYYDESKRADLKRFFDHYLKGMDNGWEFTPRVRMSVLDPGGADVPERAENAYPPERMVEKSLYLDASNTALVENKVGSESSVTYRCDDNAGCALFTYEFDEECEIAGFLNLKLWVEAKGDRDMDLYVLLNKCDSEGNPLYHNCVSHFYSGPKGSLRVSHRELDPKLSTKNVPFHTHAKEEHLSPGEIVPVEISIWPTAMLFHRGEKLVVKIAGHDLTPPPMEDFVPRPPAFKGEHVIHTGGKYESSLTFPYYKA